MLFKMVAYVGFMKKREVRSMYLCMGFGQDFLLRKLAMHVARSMARPLTVNGQTLEERHQKTEV